ncbi:MAG: HU family DNA-binding protein [Pseudomonadota bacterium]|jgi:DNA-binding protein HU-beta
MNRKELVEILADKSGKSKADADRTLGLLIETITEALAKGEDVSLVGFGTFGVSARAARQGRNPKTGETIQIAASRTPAFKAGAALKAAVNK